MRLMLTTILLGTIFSLTAQAYEIRANAMYTECRLQNPGMTIGKLLIYVHGTAIQERGVGSLSLNQARGAEAYCNSVVNSARFSRESLGISEYVLIDSQGNLDDGTLIKTEKVLNCK